MLAMLFGMVTLIKSSWLLNAKSPILVAGRPLMVPGMCSTCVPGVHPVIEYSVPQGVTSHNYTIEEGSIKLERMARPLRIEPPGRWYHVIARGNAWKSPWESVPEQAVLGGAELLSRLRPAMSGNEQEQRGARRLLARRPSFEEEIGAIERVKGRKCVQFRDQSDDAGRDLALWCCMWGGVYAG
jgi:hypothetical protein